MSLLNKKLVLPLYFLILVLFTIYSYSLLDPNLTLINLSVWTSFRNKMVQLGYYHRNLSTFIFLSLTSLMFISNMYFINEAKHKSLMKIALITGVVLFFSYPFLSHDFFNYIFDAKILAFYHQNPYLHRALDFSGDPWIRFMHWTHRRYPYGPIFLIVTGIPAFLAFGKFILYYLFFKLTWLFFYFLSVFLLGRLNKKWGMFFATHPLILIEGLVNLHNDFIALSLSIIGVYLVFKNKKIWGRIMFLLSGGVKYITLPIILIFKDKKTQYLAFLGLVSLLIYISLREIQPWYFLNLFIFTPFFYKMLLKLKVFFVGLIFSYYPYVLFGGWNKSWKVEIKHEIILAFSLLWLISISISLAKKWKS